MNKLNKNINQESATTQTAKGGQVEPLVMPFASNGGILFSRVWAMPNKWTFTIKPIAQLLHRYKVGEGWIDPFAGENSPAEITNDIDTDRETTYHLDALEFIEMFAANSKRGILLDPPYNKHQALIMYKNRKLRKITPLFEHAQRIIEPGGYLITFGWHTNGAGNKRGFQKIEILLVPHGGERNDTIITVEQKMQAGLFDE